jgi:hypothetical protein
MNGAWNTRPERPNPMIPVRMGPVLVDWGIRQD